MSDHRPGSPAAGAASGTGGDVTAGMVGDATAPLRQRLPTRTLFK